MSTGVRRRVRPADLEAALARLAAWQYRADRGEVIEQSPELTDGLLVAHALEECVERLETYGVPRSAAVSPANGIDVLAQRFLRERESLRRILARFDDNRRHPRR